MFAGRIPPGFVCKHSFAASGNVKPGSTTEVRRTQTAGRNAAIGAVFGASCVPQSPAGEVLKFFSFIFTLHF